METSNTSNGSHSASLPVNDKATSNEAIAEAFQKLLQDSEELLQASSNYSAESFNAARDRFKANLSNARNKAVHTTALMRDKAVLATKATEQYVVNNPWKSLAIVGLSGVVIGLLLRSKD